MHVRTALQILGANLSTDYSDKEQNYPQITQITRIKSKGCY